jgi:hypothetical protein
VTAPIPRRPAAPHGASPLDASSPAVLRVHETHRGRGVTYDGERPLAEVSYSLLDVEEVPDPTAPVGRRHVYGRLRTSASLRFADYVGARLVLRLADGRRLAFSVARVLEDDDLLIQGLAGLDHSPPHAPPLR